MIKKQDLIQIFNDSINVKMDFIYNQYDQLIKVINTIVTTFKNGNKILIFGNGGSASDAQHMTSELVCRLNFDRNPLPAIALTTDTSVITSISNDYDYSKIFSRQIQALGKPGDVAFGITTSGNSENIVHGIIQAKYMKMKTICLTGNNGGKIVDISELSIIIPSKNAQRIQEAHIVVIHTICQMIEKIIFGRGLNEIV
jgi:D-sedoheptulose 7-phosphate isomerase